MSKVYSIAAATAAVAAISFATASFGGSNVSTIASAFVMQPGKGVSLDIGYKHAIGYFTKQNQRCALTVVVAKGAGSELAEDSPGTRFSVQVMPGSTARIDSADGKSAEFLCGQAAKQMNTRIFDRPAWSAKSS